MSAKPPPHDCPGCQVPGIPVEQLACRRCWPRLPKPYRDALWDAYGHGTPEAHQVALDACLTWYREHPRGGR
jgi:hypothetical protein